MISDASRLNAAAVAFGWTKSHDLPGRGDTDRFLKFSRDKTQLVLALSSEAKLLDAQITSADWYIELHAPQLDHILHFLSGQRLTFSVG